MEKLFDKAIIFICCVIFLISNGLSVYTVVPIIIVISIIGLTSYFNKVPVFIAGYVFFLLLCLPVPDLIFFIPLMCYDLFCETYKYVSLAALLILYMESGVVTLLYIFWMMILSLLVYLLKKRTSQLLLAKYNYIRLRDDMMESASKLHSKNRELLEKQDYEITTATLNERNRIAREIHDTVGHLLSSSMIQIGALLAITKDDMVRDNLNNIKETLSTGMNSIRSSIHNIHEESMELETKLSDLVENFSYCPVTFTYQITHDFSMKAKYTIMFLVKEALSNVMKHSNATKISISILEMPALYQIIIEDNGSKFAPGTSGSGMGISSITERITSLEGTINISKEKGYRIFISLPKQKEGKEEEL